MCRGSRHIFIGKCPSVNWSGDSLLPSRRFNPLYAVPPLPPRRSPLVLRLFALALADGSGLPFSLHPPPAALESQTPQREARALPRQHIDSMWCAAPLSTLFRIPISAFRIILRHCPFKMCAHGAHTLTFAPKGQNISHAQSAYFTAAKRRFHTAACRRISLQSGLCPLCLCRDRLFRRGKI